PAQAPPTLPGLTAAPESTAPAQTPARQASPGEPTTPATQVDPPESGFKIDILVWGPDPKERMVYVNGRKYVEGETMENGAVIVQDGRIASVRPAATTPVPAGAATLDLTNRFVMPGLVDCHSHASIVPGLGDQLGQLCRSPVPQALAATANLRTDLASGTTTMRVMGEEHFLDLDVRAAVEAGIVVGPRLLVAGRGLAASNGHGRALASYDGVDEVRRGAR